MPLYINTYEYSYMSIFIDAFMRIQCIYIYIYMYVYINIHISIREYIRCNNHIH